MGTATQAPHTEAQDAITRRLHEAALAVLQVALDVADASPTDAQCAAAEREVVRMFARVADLRLKLHLEAAQPTPAPTTVTVSVSRPEPAPETAPRASRPMPEGLRKWQESRRAAQVEPAAAPAAPATEPAPAVAPEFAEPAPVVFKPEPKALPLPPTDVDARVVMA